MMSLKRYLKQTYIHIYVIVDYKHGIRLKTNLDGKVLITFNARNEHDRSKFVEDLREAILEVRLSLCVWFILSLNYRWKSKIKLMSLNNVFIKSPMSIFR